MSRPARLDYVTGKADPKAAAGYLPEKGMTVIVITHNSALTPMADRVIKIQKRKSGGNENK